MYPSQSTFHSPLRRDLAHPIRSSEANAPSVHRPSLRTALRTLCAKECHVSFAIDLPQSPQAGSGPPHSIQRSECSFGWYDFFP